MELHGGKIKINSEFGKGTEVILSFPDYDAPIENT